MNDTIRTAREHNARVHIHRNLSNENLCDIFLALALLDTPSLERPQGWYLQINGICHRWREVAVTYAELWARSAGSFPSIRMTDLAIQRARAVDLSFDGHFEDHNGPGYVLTDYQLSLLEKHAARLHSLVHDDYTDWADLFYRPKSFPQLERAKIWDDSEPDTWNEPIDAPRVRSLYLSNALIPFNAPNLEYLRVDMDNVAWRLSRELFGSDDIITAECQATESGSLFPTREFIEFLQRSPCLKRLIIADMPALLSEYLPSATEFHAELPFLQMLELSGKSAALGDLWQRLKVPSEAQVFIHTDYQNEREKWDSTLIREVTRSLESPLYDSLRLGMTSSYDFLLQTWSSDAHGGSADVSAVLQSTELTVTGPSFTLRLPVGSCELFKAFINHTEPPYHWSHDYSRKDEWSLRAKMDMHSDFYSRAYGLLHHVVSSTLRYLDLTDLPYVKHIATLAVFSLGQGLDFVKPDHSITRPLFAGGFVTHLVLNWSLIDRLVDRRNLPWQPVSTNRLGDYIQESIQELTIVNFPCVALSSWRRFDETSNTEAWDVLYEYLKRRHEQGWPPMSLKFKESNSEMFIMERSEEPEYVHSGPESYESAIRAVTEKGYKRVAEFITSFEDLRVHAVTSPQTLN